MRQIKASGFTRCTRVFLAIMLALTTAFIGYIHLFAKAAQAPVYLRDVQLFQGESIDEAAAKCEELGYTPLRQNLNEGAIEKVRMWVDENAPCVIMGYTVTSDRNLAVTDMRVLRMGSGYQIQDYSQLAGALLAKNQGLAEGMTAAAMELAQRYEEGSPAAERAVRVLNLMYTMPLEYSWIDRPNVNPSEAKQWMQKQGVSEKDIQNAKTSLGDYILQGDADTAFFTQMLSFSSSTTICSIQSALAAGIADYNNEIDEATDELITAPWAERLNRSDLYYIMQEGLTTDELRELDAAYMNAAASLAQDLQRFASSTLDALSRHAVTDEFDFGAGNEAEGELSLSSLMQEDAKEQISDADALYIGTYNLLNRYSYADGTSLGDWTLQMGQRTYGSEQDYRLLYPWVDTLTVGQLSEIHLIGLPTVVLNMLQTDIDEAFEAPFRKVVSEMQKLSPDGKETRLSVWVGYDAAVYDLKVAQTSDAIRSAAAGQILQHTQAEVDAENEKLRNLYVSLASGLLSVVGAVVQSICYFKFGLAATGTLMKAAFVTLWASEGFFWATMLKLAAGVAAFSKWLGLVCLVIAAAMWIGSTAKEWWSMPSNNYTEMPGLLFDSRAYLSGSALIKYRAANEPHERRVGDLNAYEGNKWNCLYLTTDPLAGSPITADADGNFFTVQKKPNLPAGYSALSTFGQTECADLNDNVYDSDGTKIYLFYHTEESLSMTDNAPDAQPSSTASENNTYMKDLLFFTGNTVDRAKAEVQKKSGNWTLFDYDFGSKGTHIYLGYKASGDPDGAITDIRVMKGESDDTVYFGEASYGRVGTLPNGDSLYFTTSTLCGSPIHAGFQVADENGTGPKGWEPVVYFSGAPLYRFEKSGGESFSLWFEPSEKFTSGEQYIAGFYLLRAEDDTIGRLKSVERRADLGNALRYYRGGLARVDGAVQNTAGFTKANEVKRSYDSTYISGGMEATMDGVVNLMKGVDPYDTYDAYAAVGIGYYLTYNPYRAVRDVAVYTGAPQNDVKLFATVSKKLLVGSGNAEKELSVSYAACELFDANGWEGNNTHAYRSLSMLYWDNNDYEYTSPPLSNSVSYGFERYRLPMQGLYVMGPAQGCAPLKTSDIVVTDKRLDAAGSDDIFVKLPDGTLTIGGTDVSGQKFRSVQEFKDPYNTYAFNLAMPPLCDEDGKGRNPGWTETGAYMYLRGQVRRPAYISRVHTGSYEESVYKAENPSVDSSTMKLINKIGDDIAWLKALSGCSGEIVPANLAVPKNESWYGSDEDDPALANEDDIAHAATYIGVSRTDSVAKALRGVTLLKADGVTLVSNGKDNGKAAGSGMAPPESINLRSPYSKADSPAAVEYRFSSGSDAFRSKSGVYYLYGTQNAGATPGSPLTSLFADDDPITAGSSTATVTDKAGDMPHGDPNQTVYLHCVYRDVGGTYLNKLYIGTGSTLREAKSDLLTQGCSECCNADLALGGGRSLVIGFRSFSVTDEQKATYKQQMNLFRSGKVSKEPADPLNEAIRDVVVRVGEPYEAKVTLNGQIYRAVSDRNLHEGLTAPQAYLYVMIDYDTVLANSKISDPLKKKPLPSQTSSFASPVVRLAMSRGDRVPYIASENDGTANVTVWENVLTAEGKRADLNEGVYLTGQNTTNNPLSAFINGIDPASADVAALAAAMEAGLEIEGALQDNRVYMFAHREDNSAKRSAEITGGFNRDTETYGALYLVP